MTQIQKHMGLLGLRVTDRITGFSGVVTSICFDLYGCVQGIINPGVGEDGKLMESQWFDVNRFRVDCDIPVMTLPNFDFGPQAEGLKGPETKPKFMKA